MQAFVFVWVIAAGLSGLAAHSTVYALFAGADRNAAKSADPQKRHWSRAGQRPAGRFPQTVAASGKDGGARTRLSDPRLVHHQQLCPPRPMRPHERRAAR